MDTMNKQKRQRQDDEMYQAAVDAVRRLTPKQKVRLLAELQDEAFGLDLAGLKGDTDLSSLDLNTELLDLDLRLPGFDLGEPDTCPVCGKRNQS